MKQFMHLQPKHWISIYTLYLNHVDDPDFKETFKDRLVQEFISKGFSQDQAEILAPVFLKTIDHPELKSSFIETDENQEEATLSVQDIRLLKEKLLHEPSQEVRRLLVALLVYARANPHPSFWIKYDKKVINFLASIQKIKVSDQNLLTIRLHNLYNLDMQVVGSNQPIPCYRISWQAEQPPIDTEENSLVLIGPLNPATITAFAASIPYEEEEGIK